MVGKIKIKRVRIKRVKNKKGKNKRIKVDIISSGDLVGKKGGHAVDIGRFGLGGDRLDICHSKHSIGSWYMVGVLGERGGVSDLVERGAWERG